MVTSSSLCPRFPTVKDVVAVAPSGAGMGSGGDVTNRSTGGAAADATEGAPVTTGTTTARRIVATIRDLKRWRCLQYRDNPSAAMDPRV
jgi:hypothetical protein